MRSDFPLSRRYYRISLLLYCAPLYCTLLIMYHKPRRQRVRCVQILLQTLILLSYFITTVVYCIVLYLPNYWYVLPLPIHFLSLTHAVTNVR